MQSFDDIIKLLDCLLDLENVSSEDSLDVVLSRRIALTVEKAPTYLARWQYYRGRDVYLGAVIHLVEKYIELNTTSGYFPEHHFSVLMKATEVLFAIGFGLSLNPNLSAAVLGDNRWDCLGNARHDWERPGASSNIRIDYILGSVLSFRQCAKLRGDITLRFNDFLLAGLVWLMVKQDWNTYRRLLTEVMEDGYGLFNIKSLLIFVFNLTSSGVPYDDSLTQTAANILHDMLRQKNGAKHFVRAFVSMNDKYWVHGMYQLAGQFVAQLQCAEQTSPLCYRRVLEECRHVFRTNGTRHVVRCGCGVILAEIYKSQLKEHLEPIGSFIWRNVLKPCRSVIEKNNVHLRVSSTEIVSTLAAVRYVYTIEQDDEFFVTMDPFVSLVLYIYAAIRLIACTHLEEILTILYTYFERRNPADSCLIIVDWLKEVILKEPSSVILHATVTSKLSLKLETMRNTCPESRINDSILAIGSVLGMLSPPTRKTIFFILLETVFDVKWATDCCNSGDRGHMVVTALESVLERHFDRFQMEVTSQSDKIVDICRKCLLTCMEEDNSASSARVFTILNFLDKVNSVGRCMMECRFQPLVHVIQKLATTHLNATIRGMAKRLGEMDICPSGVR